MKRQHLRSTSVISFSSLFRISFLLQVCPEKEIKLCPPSPIYTSSPIPLSFLAHCANRNHLRNLSGVPEAQSEPNYGSLIFMEPSIMRSCEAPFHMLLHVEHPITFFFSLVCDKEIILWELSFLRNTLYASLLTGCPVLPVAV